MIPGGVMNPDQMRANPDCVDFAQQFLEEFAEGVHAPSAMN